MKVSDLAEVARDLTSGDLIKTRAAKTQIKENLTPKKLVQLISDQAERNELKQLVSGAYEGGDESVIQTICEILHSSFKDDAFVTEMLAARRADFILEFIFSVLAHDDLSLAIHAYRVAIDAMKVTVNTTHAHFIGSLIEELFQNEKVLRLFDSDDVFSDDNSLTCNYLGSHTHLLSFITAATLKAFDDDVLLLSNYLIVCGITSRQGDMDPELKAKIHAVLDHASDESISAYCFRFCSIAVYSHNSNASQYASTWVSQAHHTLTHPRDISVGAVCNFLSSASSTYAGCTALSSYFTTDFVCTMLRNTSSVVRHSTLLLLSAWCNSTYSEVLSLLDRTVMREVWQLHTLPEDNLQEALWDVIVKALRRAEIGEHIAVVCASYLCGNPHPISMPVRERQIVAAGLLARYSVLPSGTQRSLQAIAERGLYTPGSAGVATMQKR